MSNLGNSFPEHVSRGVYSRIQPHDTAVIMHMDVQLYEMEANCYLIDFKCAGYETTSGGILEEKDVTSPFPFLDQASKLIIKLAARANE